MPHNKAIKFFNEFRSNLLGVLTKDGDGVVFVNETVFAFVNCVETEAKVFGFVVGLLEDSADSAGDNKAVQSVNSFC